MANGVSKKTAKRVAPVLRSETASVLYLYGVGPADKRTRTVASEGVDGIARVEALPCGDFRCWVSRVSRDQFADRLAENMENLDWLATASVRHQGAVAAIAGVGEILPARFGTVFTGEESLFADVVSRGNEIKAALERVAAADEWGVKIFVESIPAPRPRVQASSGSDYLKRKAAALEKRPKRMPVDDKIQEFISALSSLAVASVEGGNVSGGQANLQWQSSVLVRRAKRKQFENLLKRYASKWSDEKRIECSGPWPPYSFVNEHGR